MVNDRGGHRRIGAAVVLFALALLAACDDSSPSAPSAVSSDTVRAADASALRNGVDGIPGATHEESREPGAAELLELHAYHHHRVAHFVSTGL